jgi:hypothetical protein
MGIGRAAWGGWKARAHDIGSFQSRALLTVFYFTALVPFALILRLTGDPLGLGRRGAETAWGGWVPRDSSLEGARRQF